MTTPLPDSAETRLESIRVRSYKNLADLELAWSPAVVLIGANGAGKSNILECLALMFGTERTVNLVRERSCDVEPGSLSCVVSGGTQLLPLPPAAASRILADGGSSRSKPVFAALEHRAQTAMAWWTHLGVDNSVSATVTDAVSAAHLPPAVAQFLAAVAARPKVKYELQSLQLHEDPSREFTCTLMADEVPAEVLTHADELPQIFEPLRAWAAGSRTAPATVLALPDAQAAPVRVEWLARLRQADEIDSDLVAAMQAAETDAQHFAELVAGYLDVDVHAEGRWWLHEHAAARAAAELRCTLPEIDISGMGDHEESWAIYSGGRRAGATDDDRPWTQILSSGERRWADEALATAARSIADLGRRAAWQSYFWDEGTSDDVAFLTRVSALRGQSVIDEYVSAETLDAVAKMFDGALADRARRWLTDDNLAAHELLQAMVPSAADIARPPLTIRVLDEPEAHLHPAAQRHLAAGLVDLASENSIVLATHSPYLLGQTDWTYCSVSGGGAVNLPSSMLEASSNVAREVGWTRGEVLVTTRAVLLVEGPHDRVFLDTIFGGGFRDAGVVIVPVYGTEGTRSLVDSEFWKAFTDVPFHVMFDAMRIDAVRDPASVGGRLTNEEKQMSLLLRQIETTGRRVGTIGLDRIDIVAYVAEEVLPTSFPGWPAVLGSFKAECDAREAAHDRKPHLGNWLKQQHGVHKSETKIAEYAAQMKRDNLHPPGDLIAKVNALLANPEDTSS